MKQAVEAHWTDIERRVHAYIEQQGLIAPKEGILAGVSGGADSVCLLFMLLRLKKQWEGRLAVEAVHIHHMIRGEEADRDMEYVKKLCKEHEVPFHGIYCPVEKLAEEQGLSVEEAGRNMRYEAMEKLLRERGLDKIATAHHRDDQSETILMNLFRGSGIRGLAGMPEQRGRIIRPLLTLSREEIEQYLEEQGIAYCMDSTNQENHYTRNKIRNELIPYLQKHINKKAVEHVAALGEDAREIDAYFQKKAYNLLGKCVHREKNRVILYLEEFPQEKIEQIYLLRGCIEALGKGLKDVGRIHLEQMIHLIQGKNGGTLRLSGGLLVEKSYNSLQFWDGDGELEEQEESAPAPFLITPDRLGEDQACQITFGGYKFTISVQKWKKNASIRKKKYTKWFDYDRIKSTLQIRTRESGDYIVINAEGGRKKLKDYYIDQKVPRQCRDEIALLAMGSEILWVAGLRRCENYKTAEDTERVFVISCTEINGEPVSE